MSADSQYLAFLNSDSSSNSNVILSFRLQAPKNKTERQHINFPITTTYKLNDCKTFNLKWRSARVSLVVQHIGEQDVGKRCTGANGISKLNFPPLSSSTPPRSRFTATAKKGEAGGELTDLILPVDLISSLKEAKNFRASPPLVISGLPNSNPTCKNQKGRIPSRKGPRLRT